MAIEIINEQDIIDITDDLTDIIENCVDAVLTYEAIDFDWEVCVTLVDNNTIRNLNREFRQVDSPTDVLSFPILEFDSALILEGEHIKHDINPGTGCVMLGDIVISLERAKLQGREYGHGFRRELGFLTVHGILHLLGYDHEDEMDRLAMRKKEEKILYNLNLVRH